MVARPQGSAPSLAICSEESVARVQPSSAAAEKVFAILNSSFNDQQEHALVDYLQASVITQYNKRLLTSSMGNDDPITSDD